MNFPLSAPSCPSCNTAVAAPQCTSPAFEVPTTGDLFLCPTCGELSFYTPEGLEKVTEDQFATLDSNTRKELSFAKRDIQARHKQNLRTLAETKKKLAQ